NQCHWSRPDALPSRLAVESLRGRSAFPASGNTRLSSKPRAHSTPSKEALHDNPQSRFGNPPFGSCCSALPGGRLGTNAESPALRRTSCQDLWLLFVEANRCRPLYVRSGHTRFQIGRHPHLDLGAQDRQSLLRK